MAKHVYGTPSYVETVPSNPAEFGKTLPVNGSRTPHIETEPEKDRPHRGGTTTPQPPIDYGVTQIGDLDVNGHLRAATVGWMVGIKGACRGTDYRLHSGKNSIGRGENYVVNLTDDTSISRSGAVAEIAYDSKHRQFTILPGSNSSIAYLNGAALYLPQPINAYDRVEIGNSELIFIPLCGSHFDWEEPAEE